MTNIVEFPDHSGLSQEAAEWLIRLDADTPPTSQDLQALREWLHRSPRNREELEALSGLWGRMNILTELAVPLGKPNGANARTHAGMLAARAPWRLPKLLAVSFAVSSVAAVAIAVVLLTLGPEPDPLLATNGLYATTVGQQRTTVLSDGSEIILNTNTQIKVDYGKEYRDVRLLQGEALFTVAKNTRRPFRVYAGNGRIEALGTAFSVYLSGGDVNVTVAEGRVTLASVSQSRPQPVQPSARAPDRAKALRPNADLDGDFVNSLGTLTAGQVATIRSVSGIPGDGALEAIEPIAPEELAERLAWREGILMFSGNTLGEVVNELSRYTTVSIEIPDTAVREMRIGGRFPVGETAAMLAALETNFNLRVTRLSHNRVVLSAADE